MMFLLPENFRVNTQTIRGVQYVVFSFYSSGDHIFKKMEHLILDEQERSNSLQNSEKSLVGSGIAIGDET